MVLQVAIVFNVFYGQTIPLCRYTIQSSVEHVGCFHVLAILTCIVMNIGLLHVSL